MSSSTLGSTPVIGEPEHKQTSSDELHDRHSPEPYHNAESELEREQSRGSLNRTTSRTSAILARAVTGSKPYSSLPKMGGGKDYPPELPDRAPYRVVFEGPDDPDNALNWTIRRKFTSALPLALAALCTTFGSAINAPAVPGVAEHFHVGEVTATLTVSLYVLGFAFGPVVWGPISELYGRKLPLVLSYFLFTCFAFACATAKDFQTLAICRFFTGACGSAPLVLVAAAFADMFKMAHRGTAMIFFVDTVIGGPLIAPVVGGYVYYSYLGWRWTYYLIGIFAATVFVILMIFLEETFAPLILSRRAREIRKQTGNWGVYADQELVEFDINAVLERTILKPFHMLAVEPILLLLSLFHGYVFGLLYLLLEAVPIVFEGYGWQKGNVDLAYIALFVGVLCGGTTGFFVFEPLFIRRLQASGKPFLPEERLPMMMLGCVCFTLGMFWFFWTGAYPKHVHWLAPIFGLGLFGFGFLCVFMPPFNYIVDSYLMLAASAMAANSFVRGVMGASFPLFTRAMFHNLGIQWAGTLTGCLAALLLPVPFLFYRYGAWIRLKSKFAVNMDQGGPPAPK